MAKPDSQLYLKMFKIGSKGSKLFIYDDNLIFFWSIIAKVTFCRETTIKKIISN